MKKNRMMRLASILLVCVLLTTSVIGGTFAKYITTDNDTDTARVAKWGVTVDVEVDGAFATEYDADTKDLKDVAEAAITKTVASTDKVLAPGTKGTLLSKATITGTPEVAGKVTKVATVDLGDKWVVDGAYYCPLIINKVDGKDYTSVEDFEDAIEASLNEEFYFSANADIGATKTVAWEWPFSTSADNDKKDTALGDAHNATISFTYTITVEQVD